MINKTDKMIIRDLGAEVATIATLPIQERKRTLWKKLNALQPERPMVMIDQVCWNEFDGADGMVGLCSDPEVRQYESQLRRLLYQWHHFPVDLVIEPFIVVPKAINGIGFGIKVEEETLALEKNSEVVSHYYKNQFETEADLEKIRKPVISFDQAETDRRIAVAQELFDGTLAVRAEGSTPYLSLWGPIAMWMGVENALYALIDKPDYMHCLVAKMTDGYLSMLDQLEELGLLPPPQTSIHCTGAYTDELPAPGYDPRRSRTMDIWMFGLAQMLTTVSPAMFKEFEIDYTHRICKRFGLVYYGCCDPLDLKMKEVRQLPNLRKVSISPWADQQRAAEEIGGDLVFSAKPNPANLAMNTFDEELVRKELTGIVEVCRRHGCPLELILKDISTVRHAPERLEQWVAIAMDVVTAG